MKNKIISRIREREVEAYNRRKMREFYEIQDYTPPSMGPWFPALIIFAVVWVAGFAIFGP